MAACFSPVFLPSTCRVYVPGLVARLTPASAYQQWQAWLERNNKSCPRKLACSSLTAVGAVTRNSTGEPFTGLVGSHCAFHVLLGSVLVGDALPGNACSVKAHAERPNRNAIRKMAPSLHL